MGALGFGFQKVNGNRIADDFVVDGLWNISTLKLFAYQTNSPTASTITGAYVQIWDGHPAAGGSVIWGDLTTNRMIETSFSNIYRISETTVNT
ncbi:hypothetical protein RZS08_63345, partial [Arthrospira platensis SPKY1]|nr:hypothetical protein [Arthrospira platensis SPKY1]